jgi:hypothetical protein
MKIREDKRRHNHRPVSTPFQVCSCPLQIPIIGLFANHAYIEAPPYRYAVIGPVCRPTDGGPDNMITGAIAPKLDNSPEPCDKERRCVPCRPKSGVRDVAACLRNSFNEYNHPSLYKILGPNSNTFAGTLARTCCADMVPQPPELGTVPGWNHSPAPGRSGICPPVLHDKRDRRKCDIY